MPLVCTRPPDSDTPFSSIVALAAEATPYAEEQFIADAREASRLLGEAEAHEPAEEAIWQPLYAYFAEKYGGREAGRRYLRFGAVQAAIGKNWDLIVREGLADLQAPVPIDRFLLLLLLSAPLLVNTATGEARIAQEEVSKAVRRARVVRCG